MTEFGKDNVEERKAAGKHVQVIIDSGEYKESKASLKNNVITISIIELVFVAAIVTTFLYGIYIAAIFIAIVNFFFILLLISHICQLIRGVDKVNEEILNDLIESRDALLKGEKDPHEKYGSRKDLAEIAYNDKSSGGGYDG